MQTIWGTVTQNFVNHPAADIMHAHSERPCKCHVIEQLKVRWLASLLCALMPGSGRSLMSAPQSLDECFMCTSSCCKTVICIYTVLFVFWEGGGGPTFCWEEYVPMSWRRKGCSRFGQQVAPCLRGLPGHDLRNSPGLCLWRSAEEHRVLVSLSLTEHAQTDTHIHTRKRSMITNFHYEPVNCFKTLHVGVSRLSLWWFNKGCSVMTNKSKMISTYRTYFSNLKKNVYGRK